MYFKNLYISFTFLLLSLCLGAQSKFNGTVIKNYQLINSDIHKQDSISIYYRYSYNGSLRIYLNDSLIFENNTIQFTTTLDRAKAYSIKKTQFMDSDKGIIRVEVNDKYIEEIICLDYRFLEIFYDTERNLNLNFHNMDIYAK